MPENKVVRRGKGSPSHPLKQAIEFAELVNNAYGDTTCSREHVALALNHKAVTGASDIKVGSMTHFGLLERAPGSCYRVSSLALRILMPSSDVDGQTALEEAARSPNLYQEIIGKYEGKSVPNQLGNILAHEFGVTPKTRERTAGNFKETMEYAGLLQNGVLISSAPQPPTQNQANAPSRDAKLAAESLQQMNGTVDKKPPNSNTAATDRQHISISLGFDGRIATIDMPVPMNARDLDRIVAWAEYMKGMVDETP